MDRNECIEAINRIADELGLAVNVNDSWMHVCIQSAYLYGGNAISLAIGRCIVSNYFMVARKARVEGTVYQSIGLYEGHPVTFEEFDAAKLTEEIKDLMRQVSALETEIELHNIRAASEQLLYETGNHE